MRVERPGNRRADSLQNERLFEHVGIDVVRSARGAAIDLVLRTLDKDRRELLAELDARGIERRQVTLHVGAGTFQPVRVDDIEEHLMHAEYLDVPAETCEAVERARERGGRVVAVGTTAVRALETAARAGALQPCSGDTVIFICPGYRFRAVEGLITNFHLPESTLLMLVCALAGTERTLAAYRHAVSQRYRFFSYGDAMLIL